MPARCLFVFAFLVCFGACSGPPNGPDSQPILLDAWVGLDAAASSLAASEGTPCDPDFGTYFEEFGVRALACVAAEVMPPSSLVGRSAVRPFVSGPHSASGESFRLDLTNERDFGHYNGDFVDWVVENGIVGEGRPALRALTQSIYDGHIRRLARIYWLTYQDMRADGFPDSTPAGILSDYADFLEGGTIPEGAESYEGGFSVFAFTDLSEGLLARIGLPLSNDWNAKYEANTAYGFWLRRRADGTQENWRDGLERLLETYDGDWLVMAG